LQVTNYHINTHQNTDLQNIYQNLTNIDDKKALRKAISQLPSKDIPKFMEKIKKIPADENYLKNIMQTLKTDTNSSNKKGFEIYA
jgi:hypothetical protein